MELVNYQSAMFLTMKMLWKNAGGFMDEKKILNIFKGISGNVMKWMELALDRDN